MNISPVEIWFAIGIIFILIEFSTIPGIGFLFVGFGSLSNAVLIYNYPELAHYQITLVGILSMTWLIILWKPLQIYLHGYKKDRNNPIDIVGNEVKVFANTLVPGIIGQVQWSGTIMNAMLEDSEAGIIEVGQILYISRVRGNILICSKVKLPTAIDS